VEKALKRVLIISPYFPPSNAADMHRIRMSLPYFEDHGWEAEVVCVDESYSEMVKDNLLLASLPADLVLYKVDAFRKRWTSKIGLGSLALRSLWFFRKRVNKLLRINKYDLIYFSTTQFPVCILGAYWNKKFNIPYIIDMQDPWHSDYYQDKPKNQRPKKYWFSYRLNKFLEPIAVKRVGGLIAVSDKYIETLKKRYPVIGNIPAATVPFGASELDRQIASEANFISGNLEFDPDHINIVCLGRGGIDMHTALSLLFKAVKKGIKEQKEKFERIHTYFIGTSYAAAGTGQPTILPLALEYSLQESVTELTDRLPFYAGLKLLQSSDILLVPGSNDPQYTASKLYPYLQSGKAIIAILHQSSSAVTIMKNCLPGEPVFTFPGNNEMTVDEIFQYLGYLTNHPDHKPKLDHSAFEQFTAREMTRRQTELFNKVIKCEQF
jgi:hypothetical protein